MSGLLEAAIYTELAIVCGIVLDLLIGDPEQLCSVHPVVLMGKCISFLEKKLRKAFPATKKGELTAGALMAVMMVFGTLASTILVSYIAFRIHIVLFFIVQAIMCWQAVAIRDLKKESMDVYDCLEPELDIEKARAQVSRIVGRDTQELTAVGVTKAVVETIAENFSDGIVCPLFYMMIGGGPLALTYKAVNTMDSMVGYKNDRYMFFGRTGAHMDDVCGFIPSRIAAFFWIAAAAFINGRIQDPDAVSVGDGNDLVLKSHFAAGAEHAVGHNAPQLALLDLHAAFLLRLTVERSRDQAVMQRHRYICSLKNIRSTGHDLEQSVFILAFCFFVSDVDPADHELVRVRMRLDLLDLSHDHVLNVLAEPVAGLQVRSGHDHLIAELVYANIA